jgi:putative YhbY family RNA-binding protein
MSAVILTPAVRKEHRAQAHHLNPVVMIGAEGLSESVIQEVDHALNAHGLIKVRVHGDDRLAREAMLQSLADQLNAAPIQHIGKLFVLWREKTEKEVTREIDPERKAGPRDFKVLKYAKRGGQRPEVRTLTVLGNQRLSAGGQVKRAKPKQKSVKKSSQKS